MHLAEILEYRHGNIFTIVLLGKLSAIELLEFKYSNGELNTRIKYRLEWNARHWFPSFLHIWLNKKMLSVRNLRQIKRIKGTCLVLPVSSYWNALVVHLRELTLLSRCYCHSFFWTWLWTCLPSCSKIQSIPADHLGILGNTSIYYNLQI